MTITGILRYGALLLGVVAAPSYAALIHQYDLDGSFTDNFGGPSLTSGGGTLSATNYVQDFGQGLSLSSPGISSVYTMDMLISLDAACASKYCKLLDFKDRTTDIGLYSDTGNRLNFWNITGSGPATVGTGATVQITLSRDAAGNVTGYVNGSSQWSFLDAGLNGVFSGSNNIVWFLQDEGNQGLPGEHTKGSVEWIRIYDTAQSPGQYVVGEGLTTAVPEPGTIALIGLGLAGLTRLRRSPGRT
jgi:hypothetical protein